MLGINEGLCIGGGFLGLGFGCLHVLLNLLLDLGEVLSNVLVALLELLLSKLGDGAVHHALLILEEAVRSTKEAVKSDDLLEEAHLGVSTGVALLMGGDGLLDGVVDLGVDLTGRERGRLVLSLSGLEGFLDHGGNFLNVSLGVDGGGLDTRLLLNGNHQTNWNKSLGQFEGSRLLSLHVTCEEISEKINYKYKTVQCDFIIILLLPKI